MMTEVGSAISSLEKPATEVDFRQEVRRRLHEEHPDLIDRWLPLIDDPDPYGRLFGYPALQACMNVRDSRLKIDETQKHYDNLTPTMMGISQ